MRKNLRFVLSLVSMAVLCFFVSNSNAQSKTPEENALALIKKNIAKLHLSEDDVKNLHVADVYSNKASGTIMVYAQQTYKGVPVYNSLQVMAFKNETLVSVSGGRVAKIAVKTGGKEVGITPAIPASDAIGFAARHLKLNLQQPVTELKRETNNLKMQFSNAGIAQDDIRVQLMWVPLKDGKVKLGWQVQIAPLKSSDHWLIRVDSKTGEILSKDNLTVSCNWSKAHTHTLACYKIKHEEVIADDADEDAPLAPGEQDVTSAGYKVVPFPIGSPTHPGGTPSLQLNPWTLSPSTSPATTLQWQSDSTTTYTITRGNNVYAQDDRDNNNATYGSSPASSTALPNLTFNFTQNTDLQPIQTTNQSLAITNLFYWNNIMHDISYQYGFDEVSGNYQASNQGRGGKGKDFVIADAQDAGAFNNANFSAPPDGQNGRMQMYLFNSASYGKILDINKPAAISGFRTAVEGLLSDKNRLLTKGPLTADVALFKDDAAGTTSYGCNTAANATALAGKIALIFVGGNCGSEYVTKIKNAQIAGAVGVIIASQSSSLYYMYTDSGDPDNSVTIPAVMVSLNTGNGIKAQLTAGVVVNVTLNAIYLDGDLDNTVISHEYTHGISGRLTGGPSNTGCLNTPQSESYGMNEGWSDYMSLMVTTSWPTAKLTDGALARPIGTYVLGESYTGSGIRNFPYSTDLNINPLTYDSVATFSGGEQHNIGEIWCVTLWDMTWNIIQKAGSINTNLFNATATGGNSDAIKLVLEAQRLQPCNPGFVDSRDALLKADAILFNSKYDCDIWKAFAKRGVGYHASQGSSADYTDQVADYTLPSAAIVVKHVNKTSAAQNETIDYTMNVTCQCAAINNYKLVDTIPSNTTYISSAGTYDNAKKTVSFSGISLSPLQSQSYTVKVQVNTSTYSAPVIDINEPVASTTIAATWVNTSTTGTKWTVQSARSKSTPNAFFAQDNDSVTNAVLTSANAYKLTGISTLSFWHYFNTEAGYDGGIVEISTDNGTTWTDLGPYMVTNGYNATIASDGGIYTSGKDAFSGSSGTFIQTTVNLTSFAGKTVKIRFYFASDEAVGSDGWYLDDILLKSEAGVYNKALLYNGSSILQSSSDTLTMITSATLPVLIGSFTAEKQGSSALLKWNTLQEINASLFIVERSADGANYTNMGTVKAFGNSNTEKDYQFTDVAPLAGNNFYRLKQMDKDGLFVYSEVRSLYFGNIDRVISISPNPAKDKIAVTITGNNKQLQLHLINADGQLIKTFTMTGQYQQLTLPALAGGVYYLKITGEGVDLSHKLVIKK